MSLLPGERSPRHSGASGCSGLLSPPCLGATRCHSPTVGWSCWSPLFSGLWEVLGASWRDPRGQREPISSSAFAPHCASEEKSETPAFQTAVVPKWVMGKQQALSKILPDGVFPTHSFPFSVLLLQQKGSELLALGLGQTEGCCSPASSWPLVEVATGRAGQWHWHRHWHSSLPLQPARCRCRCQCHLGDPTHRRSLSAVQLGSVLLSLGHRPLRAQSPGLTPRQREKGAGSEDAIRGAHRLPPHRRNPGFQSRITFRSLSGEDLNLCLLLKRFCAEMV